MSKKTLVERLDESRARIGKMCSELRPPSMSIPPDQDRDDDMFIIAACKEAETEIKRLTAELEAARGRVAELEAKVGELMTQRVEDLETILLAGSYPYEESDESRRGWLSHTCMSDQESALHELLELGVYELHPKYEAYFRRKPLADGRRDAAPTGESGVGR